MKIYDIYFSLFLLVGCSSNERNLGYYENNSVFFKEVVSTFSDTVNYTHYYINHTIMDNEYSLKNDNLLVGIHEEFYPDGFPKNRCFMDKGIDVKPKETGKSNGYDLKIDFGPYIMLESGIKVRPFRTFVDGVSTNEYIVSVADTLGHEFLPKQLSKLYKDYVIYNADDLSDTNTVRIDETMYPYYIEDMDLAKMVNTHGDTCFLVYFYYKSVFNHPYPNDERMVVMHDSLNWEVTEFIKHYK